MVPLFLLLQQLKLCVIIRPELVINSIWKAQITARARYGTGDLLNLQKRNCNIRIRLTPLDVCFVKVELRINGIRHYYYPSSVMGGQFNDLIDALYVLYHENKDSHGIHKWKPKVEWIKTENGNEVTSISSRFTWDEEGSLIKVSLRRDIRNGRWEANPNSFDPVIIKISGRGSTDDFECTVDGRDLCYAAAKAYTEALKKYGFYGYYSSTCDDYSVNVSVLIERFLFIKAYALNAMEARALTKAWSNSHSWHIPNKTNFGKEMELLLFDM